MATIIQITIPMYIANFRPTRSAILPEKGLEIAADIVNKVMISPFLSGAPNLVIKSFNSGMIKLKLVIKNNIDHEINQKFLLYFFSTH